MNARPLSVEEAAADWVARLDKKAVSPEPDDVIASLSKADANFAVWVRSSLEHRVAFLRLYAAWQRADQLMALSPAYPIPARKSHRLITTWAAIAAAACVIIGLGATLYPVQWFQHWQVEETLIGQQKQVVLEDGTRIELNTNSRISSHFSKRDRTVILERGEAYFDVTEDKERPFQVEAGNNRLVVLGTEFSVRRRPNDLKVVVADGTVKIENLIDNIAVQTTITTKGSLVVARADGTFIERKSERELANELAWLRGLMIFEHKSLSSIAEEFNRYSTVRLVPADAATGDELIGGSFKVNNVETFARLLRDDFGFQTQRRGDVILITR